MTGESAAAEELPQGLARWGQPVDGRPWLHRGPAESLSSLADSITPPPLRVDVSGSDCRTVGGTLSALAAGLDFPAYYGANADAFEECLSDLLTRTDTLRLGAAFGDRDGVAAEAVLVVVDRADVFLADGGPGEREHFYRIVDHALDADAVSSPYREDPTCRRAGFFIALVEPVD